MVRKIVLMLSLFCFMAITFFYARHATPEWAHVLLMVVGDGAYQIHHVDGVGKKGTKKHDEPYYAPYEERYLDRTAHSGYASIDTRLVIRLPMRIVWSAHEKPESKNTDVIDSLIYQATPESLPEKLRFSGEREFINSQAAVICSNGRIWLLVYPWGGGESMLTDYPAALLKCYQKKEQ